LHGAAAVRSAYESLAATRDVAFLKA
ncbi:MAG: hypothetical protein RIS83_443, partial [Pseudomonadota bacterium]